MTLMNSIRKVMVLTLTFTFLASCGGGDGDNPYPPEAVQSVPLTWKENQVISGEIGSGDEVLVTASSARVGSVMISEGRWSCNIEGLTVGDNEITIAKIPAESPERTRNIIITRFELPSIQPGRFVTVGHRGAPRNAPENSLAAVNYAWQAGANIVEIDLHLSLDNRIMVIHNPTTGTTTGVSLIVKGTPSEELRQLNLKPVGRFTDEKIPFLEEVLDYLPPERMLILHVKTGTEIVPHLKEILAGKEKIAQVAVLSSSRNLLEVMMAEVPGITVILELQPGRYDEANLGYMSAKGIPATASNYTRLTQPFVNLMRSAGKQVFAYTVNDPEKAGELIDMGVTHLITDVPEKIRLIQD